MTEQKTESKNFKRINYNMLDLAKKKGSLLRIFIFSFIVTSFSIIGIASIGLSTSQFLTKDQIEFKSYNDKYKTARVQQNLTQDVKDRLEKDLILNQLYLEDAVWKSDLGILTDISNSIKNDEQVRTSFKDLDDREQYFAFKYFEKIKNKLPEQSFLNSVMMNRSYTFVVYMLMIAMLIYFFYITFRRYLLLNKSFSDSIFIEKEVFDDGVNVKNIESIDPQKSNAKKYLLSLYQSFKSKGNTESFSSLFSLYKSKELDSADMYQEKAHKSMVWVIRLGIFGTLWGLLIAFFEMYSGISVIDTKIDNPLTNEFFTKINTALMGNAIAVATSVGAHFVTLVIEFFISRSMNSLNNLSWIDSIYERMLVAPNFNKNKNLDEASSVIDNELNIFKKSIQGSLEPLDNFGKEIGKMSKRFEKSFSNFDNMSEDLTQLKDAFKELREDMQGFNKQIGPSQKQIVKSFNELKTNTEKLSLDLDKLSKVASSAGNVMSESLTQTVGSVRESLATIKEGIKKIQSVFKK